MSLREKQEERDFIREIIQLYKRLPALWNRKSKEYHNRDKKNFQYEVLLCKYRERYPGATKNDLLKRINSLRVNFRKELKRMNNAHAEGNLDIQPILWYYEEMKFVMNQENETEHNNEVEETFIVPIKTQLPKMAQKKQEEKPQEHKTVSSFQTKFRTILPKAIDPPLTTAATNNVEVYKHFAPMQSEYEKIAAVWATELQNMDARQQLFAKKAINDILFEGQLGNLHKNSIEINRLSQDTSEESFTENNYEPTIVFNDCEPKDTKVLNYDPIDHDLNASVDSNYDPIDHDANASVDLNLNEEEVVMEDVEIINDENLELLENSNHSEEEQNTNDQNESQEETLECQVYTFSDWQKEHGSVKRSKKDKQMMCSYCSKVLSNKRSLMQHEETHLEQRERKFVCPHCGLKFLGPCALRSHIPTHDQNREKKLKCEFCDKSYFNRGGLNIHRRIHLGQMLQCPLCPKEYYRKVDLDRHVITHSAAPMHNVMKKHKYLIHCKDCGKKVATKRWRTHKAVHLNKPLVKCSICDKNFFSRSSCSRHVRLLHNVPRENYADAIIEIEENFERQSFLLLKQNETIEAMEMT